MLYWRYVKYDLSNTDTFKSSYKAMLISMQMYHRYDDDFFFKVDIHYQRVVLYNGSQPIECSPKIY